MNSRTYDLMDDDQMAGLKVRSKRAARSKERANAADLHHHYDALALAEARRAEEEAESKQMTAVRNARLTEEQLRKLQAAIGSSLSLSNQSDEGSYNAYKQSSGPIPETERRRLLRVPLMGAGSELPDCLRWLAILCRSSSTTRSFP